MKKIYYQLFLLIFVVQTQAIASSDVYKIKFKVNNEIITNYDIIKEQNYLKALNKTFKEINQNEIKKIASNSLIKEKIKKREIEKHYVVNYESNVIEPIIDNFIRELNLTSLDEFKDYLIAFDFTIDELREKLIVERTWNKLIFDLYKDKIRINENEIKSNLDKMESDKSSQKSFNLSEIVFIENDKENYKKKYDEIISSINKIGFKDTASIYSISTSSKMGGSIGWVNQNQLSKIILDEIIFLEATQVSKPILTPGGSIIIKVNEIKDVPFNEFNREEELAKIKLAEKNRQLNEFSVIHYKKIANKSYVENF
jgi:peptidyl-prolyl cis-trans isomerase SurA